MEFSKEGGRDEIDGILRSRTFPADPENNFPQIIIQRDSSGADILQGTVYSVTIDNLDKKIGTDYEWSGGEYTSDKVKRFERNGEVTPRTNPDGDIYIGAGDPTHNGSKFFNDMEVRRIKSERIEKSFWILKLAEDLRRRAEGREPTKSEREAQQKAIGAQMLANRDRALAESQAEEPKRNLGRRAINTLTQLFRRRSNN